MTSAARAPLLSGLLGAAAVLGVAGPVSAATCSTLPNAVFVAGSGDVAILGMSKALAAAGITIIYDSIPSCQAVGAVLNGTKVTTTPNPTAAYYDTTGMAQQCDIDPTGQVVDLAVSDVFPSTCMPLPNGLPNGFRDFFGPVEAMTFVVPKKSSQQAISKAAAYFVYGFGTGSGVAPWTDASFIFQRDPTSGTQNELGVAIDVPATKWLGTGTVSSSDMVTKVATSTNTEGTIGILTAEVANANPSQVSILAYKDEGQSCSYFPDSTQTGRDKINVRDGHYALWGPLHMVSVVDASNQPVNAGAHQIVAFIEGTMAPPAGVDLIALFAQVNLIPQCAMRVQRTSEIGPMASFAPNLSCGCYFEQSAAGTTSCKACKADTDCPQTAPRCNYGFCETQ